MNVELKTGQLAVLNDFFRGLSTIDQRKVFAEGFRKSAKPLVDVAKANVPVGRTGNLKRSIGTMMLSGGIGIMVGTLRQRKGWHGHLVESGTNERVRKSGGATGRMPATHFFERAFETTKEQVYSTIEEEWYKAIDNVIIRTNKKLK